MEPTKQELSAGRQDDAHEVRSYLFKLIGLIVLGALFMTTVAIIAWNRYAAGVVQNTPPGPPGAPPSAR